MIDDDKYHIPSVNSTAYFIPLKISQEKCVSYGYQEAVLLKSNTRRITSWDKALLYFCVLNQNYSFIWFVEEDLFISSVQAFRSIHQLYSTNSDLIVPSNKINLMGDTSIWHWPLAVGKFVPPWSSTMVNIAGLSRRMLSAIANDIQWRGKSLFHEIFFNTLAISLNMTMVTPREFSTVVYRRIYHWKEIRRQPNNFWHPIKDSNIRHSWRQRLAYLYTLTNEHSRYPII